MISGIRAREDSTLLSFFVGFHGNVLRNISNDCSESTKVAQDQSRWRKRSDMESWRRGTGEGVELSKNGLFSLADRPWRFWSQGA